MLGHDAHDHVIETTGGKGNDEGDGTGRVGLRGGALPAWADAGENGQSRE